MGYFAAAAMNNNPGKQTPSGPPQSHLDVIENIIGLDVDEMTPRQAHDALYQLKQLLGSENSE
jgi:hypothetical protein